MSLDAKYEIHFAPLQGLTDVSFRRLHASLFSGVDFYYTPFLRIERGLFRKKDLRDLADDCLPNLVPQILPGTADEVKRLCEPVLSKGFKRVDVNVGCPFPPIMSHNRGAALLNNPEKLADVLKGMSEMPDVEFSLKMRLGYDRPDQWKDVIGMINDSALRHVTVHARIAKQQYKGECNRDAFAEIYSACSHPVIYNGDLRTVGDIERLVSEFPELKGVMVGRGLLADMSLGRKLRGLEPVDEKKSLKALHDQMLMDAQSRMTEPRQVAEHMKPYWEYFCQDSDAHHRELKAIKKSNNADKYIAAAEALFSTL